MEKEKTSVLSNGLIWFGAAISIAEILTGTIIAPLGFAKGLLAICIGHLIGGLLMYFAGLIGANTGRSSMGTVKLSFGEKGSVVFSFFNILQLIGWTSIMIVSGASAANSIVRLGGNWVWSLIIGALIIVWILVGFKNLSKINIVAIGGLFALTIVMSIVIFNGTITPIANDGISFGAAVELSVAMPLSWLPLISDYTRTAKKKKSTTLVTVLAYSFASCWMYAIGMGAKLFTGESDIAQIMISAGFGIVGLLIVVFSTVTTTFLDAFSAGVSSTSISKKINEKWAGVLVCVIGMFIAIFIPPTEFQDFLYIIGSIFAPMTAILITDFFILKKDTSNINCNIKNLLIWAIGFVIYRVFIQIDTPIGNTFPVMIIVSIICIICNKISWRK